MPKIKRNKEDLAQVNTNYLLDIDERTDNRQKKMGGWTDRCTYVRISCREGDKIWLMLAGRMFGYTK